MAETLTDKLKLSKRDTGDINWGQGANANLDAVDQHAQQAILRPPRTLSASLGSGAVGANLLGNTTYFYKVTAVNAAGETTEGKIPAAVEAQVTESASPVPVILSWETVKGATGYKIYKSTLSGQEKFLASVAGESTAIYTDDGNTATNGAISVPAANTARTSVSKIVAGANVTISPPDGTGDVTVNATVPAPSDASDTVKGVTKLSVAPILATNPIAVGDNDSRNTNARTPTGAAGGDLSGTYPNPAVAKVNGTSVPASPSAGQVLTATGPTAAAWQAPTGGGYATAVVAAPSGVAATDTSNIQSAIDSVSAAGGGSVILREGIYQISTTINPKSGVTIRGQGKSTVQNTGLSGTSGGGSPSGTTLRGTIGLGTTKMIADAVSVPINVTFRDLNLDFGKVARGSITGQDMVMHGSNLTFINVTFIMMASVGNPSVDITPTNINDIGKNKFIGCDFYDAGTAATVAFQLDGQITGCYFEGTVATFSELLNFFSGSIVGCYFATNIVYNTALIRVAPNNNGPATVNITGCYFKQFLGTQTDAIRVDNITPGVVSITGNTAHSTAVGQIRVLASAGKRVVVGNCGFNAYSGGDQAGNDGQTAINSGGAAGGDLSGTYPNPTVAKVNGTSVPASPSAGQVLTATGPTAATWQAPASGGYAKVVVAAPTGVAATDTANIQAALTTAASAPGGVVILREGTYVVNNTLTLASRVTLQGQGMRDVTIIRADDAMGNVAIIAGAASAIAPEVRDLAIDGRHFFRGTKTVADIRFDQSTSKVVLRRVRLVNPAGIDSVWGSSLAIANGGMVIGCDFFIAGAVAAVFLSSNNFLEVKDSVFDLAVAGTQNVISIAAEGVISKNTFQTQQSLLDAIIKFGSGVEAGRAVVSGNRFNASVVNTSAIKFNQAITARATIYGNVAATTAPGNITVTNTVAAIVGNVGFASYVGGSQMVGNV